MPENIGESSADLIADSYILRTGLLLRPSQTGGAQDDPWGRPPPPGAPTPVKPFHLGAVLEGAPIVATSALGANVTSVTPVAGSNDVAGQLTIVAGGVVAANTVICTVTFGLAYALAPWQVDIAPAEATAAATGVTGALDVRAFNVLGASFQLTNRVAGAGAATYIVSYNVMGASV